MHECPVCRVRCGGARNVFEHVRKRHPDDPAAAAVTANPPPPARGARQCPECGVGCGTERNVEQHRHAKHPEVMGWCDLCREELGAAADLPAHYADKHPDGLQCSECQRW